MYLSKNLLTGDGSTTDFAVTFPYLEREHVFLSVDGVEKSFTWVNDGMIRSTETPSGGSDVVVFRHTPSAFEPLSDNTPNRAARYNTLTAQAIYIAQEAEDSSDITRGDYEDIETVLAAIRDAAEKARDDAGSFKDTAASAATTATQAATAAQNSADTASDAATRSEAAVGASEQSASLALDAKTGSEGARDVAVAAKAEVLDAQASIEVAKADAEGARDEAVTAQNAAQLAHNDTQDLLSSASDYAIQAGQSRDQAQAAADSLDVSGFLNKAGDEMTGSLKSSSKSPLWLKGDPALPNTPAFVVRYAGEALYFLMTAPGDKDGTWTGQRPFTIGIDGSVQMDGPVRIDGTLSVGSIATDDGSAGGTGGSNYSLPSRLGEVPTGSPASLDTIKSSGWGRTTSSADVASLPTAETTGIWQCLMYSTTNGIQTWYQAGLDDVGQVWMRQLHNDVWKPWRLVQADQAYLDGRYALKNEVEASFYYRPEAYGTITYGRDVTDAQAQANKVAIQAALNAAGAAGGGTVFLTPGKTYKVYEPGSNGYCLLWNSNNVHLMAQGACLVRRPRSDLSQNLLRIGQQPNTNGRVQVAHGSIQGLEADNGMDVQKIKNSQFRDDLAGWTAVGATLQRTTDLSAYRMRVIGTQANSSTTARAAYQMKVVPGIQHTIIANCVAAKTGSILSVSKTNSTNSNGIVSETAGAGSHQYRLTFTPDTDTVYALCYSKTGSAADDYSDWTDVFCFPNYNIDTEDYDGAIIGTSGLQDFVFNGLHLHDSKGYAIGFENGGHCDVRVCNSLIEDIMHDGIDNKNNGSFQEGNSISNLVVKRFGLTSGTDYPAAGIDLSQGWVVNNLTLLDFGVTDGVDAGLRMKQGEATDDRGVGGQNNVVTGLRVKAWAKSSDFPAVSGVHFQSAHNALSGFDIEQCPTGIDIEVQGIKVSTGRVAGSSNIGIHTRDGSYDKGDYASVVAVDVTGCGTGVKMEADKGLFMMSAYGNTTNVSDTGSNNNKTIVS